MKIIPKQTPAPTSPRSRQEREGNPLNFLRAFTVQQRHLLVMSALLTLGLSPLPATPPPADFSGWHLPLPAGQWLISRGPCDSAAPFDHLCRYYEESCAVDLVSATGSMDGIPVLAPAAGNVFFLGTRDDAGLTLMLLHGDGRLSSFMHLSKIVVSPDEPVAQGQVLGYAGNTGSSGGPHLHFFVQPNAVERACLPLEGLDEINYVTLTATSRNRAWSDLILPDPPQVLADKLSPQLIDGSRAEFSARFTLPAGSTVKWPVLLTGALRSTAQLRDSLNHLSTVLSHTEQGALFQLSIETAGPPGARSWPLYSDAARTRRVFSLTYTVTQSLNTTPATGLIFLNPTMLSPIGYKSQATAPRLCWSASARAGQAPFEYRAVLVGPTSADSGWIGDTCWQSPKLLRGTYYWKVFVRDAHGHMNRTNQRPAAFVMK